MRSLGPVLIFAIVCLLGCQSSLSPPPGDDDLFVLPEFTLQESRGQELGKRQLTGKVWVAGFIFTRCAGPCPRVSGVMAQLQHELSSEPDVRLVSFTVDPEYDSPEVLSRYAQRFGAQPERWLFVTGGPSEVFGLIRDGFHLTAQPNQGAERTPGNEVLHDTRLAVVDKRGHVRGYYDVADPEAVAGIEAKVKQLLAEKG